MFKDFGTRGTLYVGSHHTAADPHSLIRPPALRRSIFPHHHQYAGTFDCAYLRSGLANFIGDLHAFSGRNMEGTS